MSTALLQRNTALGLVASVLLAAAKLLAGLIGNATALVADAVESLADAAGSIIVWLGLAVAARPPDRDHPYGHGKAEAIAALTVGGMLLAAAAVIVAQAFHDIVTPHRPPAAWTLLVLAVVVAVKEGLFRLLLGGARQFESLAAEADAWHHRSDAITSVAAFVGVSIAVWGPQATGVAQLVLADEVAAILASGIIVRTAVLLVGPPLRELLDAAPHELIARIRRAAAEVEGVVLVEKLYARKSGHGYLVDMHLHVNPELTVRVAHALAHRVEAHLRGSIPNLSQVLIHVEPAEAQDGQ